MIVVAILAIIASMAIPNLLESKKVANEATAISALRTLGSAEELYNTKYATYGTLTELAGRRIIDSVLGAQDTESPKGGYKFTITTLGATMWCCTAQPITWGTTGEREFRCTQDGVIYYSTIQGELKTGGTALGKAEP